MENSNNIRGEEKLNIFPNKKTESFGSDSVLFHLVKFFYKNNF